MKSLGSLTRFVPPRAAAAAALIAVVAGVVLGARMMHDPTATTAAAPVAVPRQADMSASPAMSSAPQPSSAQPRAARPDTRHDDSVQQFPPAASAPAAAAATATATSFAGAWVRRDLPTQQWWAGVAGYCERGFADRLRTAVSGDGPAGKITGPVTPVTSRVGLAIFQVPTDAGVLQVSVALIDGAWKVTTTDWRRP